MTVTSSHEAIEMEASAQRLKDRQDFYDPHEMEAANKVVSRIIKRYRWKRIIQHAKARNKVRESARRAKLLLPDPLATDPANDDATNTDSSNSVDLAALQLSFIPAGGNLLDSSQAAKLVELELSSTEAIAGPSKQKPRSPSRPGERAGSRAKKRPQNGKQNGKQASTAQEHGREHPGRSVGGAPCAQSAQDAPVSSKPSPPPVAPALEA